MATTLPIPKDRNLYLPKQVDQASMNDLTKSIIDINENDEHLKKLYDVYGMEYTSNPIKIYIDSYGGCCYEEEVDCAGVCGGDTLVDICGICDGDGLSCTMLGDLNSDGNINVVDIVVLIEVILNVEYNWLGDLNDDNINNAEKTVEDYPGEKNNENRTPGLDEGLQLKSSAFQKTQKRETHY